MLTVGLQKNLDKSWDLARDIFVRKASFTTSQQDNFTLHENVRFGSKADITELSLYVNQSLNHGNIIDCPCFVRERFHKEPIIGHKIIRELSYFSWVLLGFVVGRYGMNCTSNP